MDTACFTKALPATATEDAETIEPTVKAGIARFSNLTVGGSFYWLAVPKKPLVVEALDNPGNATITIKNLITETERAAPAETPFKVASNEVILADQGTPGDCTLGVLIREDIPER